MNDPNTLQPSRAERPRPPVQWLELTRGRGCLHCMAESLKLPPANARMGAMPGDPKECRLRAKECSQMAKRSATRAETDLSTPTEVLVQNGSRA
jgi:hypothetical protein